MPTHVVPGIAVSMPLRTEIAYRKRDGGWYRATRKYTGVTIVHNERVR